MLVHGAFADASGWDGVTERLQDEGYTVLAPPNPLRGVTRRRGLHQARSSRQLPGPIVLVGHSYGGFVITNAATGNANVKALVYIAAFAPAQGDTVQALTQLAPGSQLGPRRRWTSSTTRSRTARPSRRASIKPALFREIFAADLPRKQAAVMAAAQRPASLITLGEPSGPPAWATIPSYYLVAGARTTRSAPPNLRIMAKRAKAKTVEVKGASHVVMISRPRETTDLIVRAAKGR